MEHARGTRRAPRPRQLRSDNDHFAQLQQIREGQKRTFCDPLHCVPRKGSELVADVPEAAYVGLPLLREFERRRDVADEYAGCH